MGEYMRAMHVYALTMCMCVYAFLCVCACGDDVIASLWVCTLHTAEGTKVHIQRSVSSSPLSLFLSFSPCLSLFLFFVLSHSLSLSRLPPLPSSVLVCLSVSLPLPLSLSLSRKTHKSSGIGSPPPPASRPAIELAQSRTLCLSSSLLLNSHHPSTHSRHQH